MSILQKLKNIFAPRIHNYGLDDSKLQNHDKNPLLRLHLGCGNEYLPGWVNIDVTEKSKADLVMDFKNIKDHFSENSVDEILMIHSISYLRLWEARDYFSNIYLLLAPGGKIVLEFPDIAKCSKAILDRENNVDGYLEAVRAFYAFDMGQIKNRDEYHPYAFGWSAWHMSYELKITGFSKVLVQDPLTHGPLLWRDTRIEAIK